MFKISGDDRRAQLRSPHPILAIALFPHSARANDFSQDLQVIGTMSVFVIIMLMPIHVLKITNSLLYAVVAIFQEPFCSGESPNFQ